MSDFDDLYVAFLSPVIADEAIATRREAVELLSDDTPICDHLYDIISQVDTPIEVRLTNFDSAIIDCSDEFLKEYGIEVVNGTSIGIRTDMITTIKEVRDHLDPELIVDTIESGCNSLESFGELCSLFGSLDPEIYIGHLHYVMPETLNDITQSARDRAFKLLEEAEHNDNQLLTNFTQYLNELDERSRRHYEVFSEGLSECYSMFNHGMGLYIDEIKADLEDDFPIACLKMATIYAISKDKEAISDEGLIADLTKSIGAFITSDYLNKIVLKTHSILREVLTHVKSV